MMMMMMNRAAVVNLFLKGILNIRLSGMHEACVKLVSDGLSNRFSVFDSIEFFNVS